MVQGLGRTGFGFRSVLARGKDRPRGLLLQEEEGSS